MSVLTAQATRRWLIPRLILALLLLACWLVVLGCLLRWIAPEAARGVMAVSPARLAGVLALALAVIAPALCWALLRWGWRAHMAPARLAEQARVLAEGGLNRPLGLAEHPAELAALVACFNQLAGQREALQAEVAVRVAEASRGIERERSRLASLMAELTQSVVVCNLDGQVLLYNHRARLQFRALSSAPTLADGGELLGLGRSIYAALDRRLVSHALESLQHRLQRGAEHPAAQFVTVTRSGQLLRVQMAPVREVAATNSVPAGPATLSGFVLMLDNITRELEHDRAHDQLLHSLTEGERAGLGRAQAWLSALEATATDKPEARARALEGLHDELHQRAVRLETAQASVRALQRRWPLEDMLGADLVAAVQRNLVGLGLRAGEEDVDPELWLRVDSYSLLLALRHLAGRLQDEFAVRSVWLRLQSDGTRHAHLDLIWAGLALSTETVMGWESDPLPGGGEAGVMSVRDVVARHGGHFGFERERVRHRGFFRFRLPCAEPQQALSTISLVPQGSRPEFYDFDLFQPSETHRDLDQCRLADLAYTVFDTETTGLDPRAGDEIIQIGAVRISGGKLRRHECFEQLVDPRRPIPLASIPIHGITPERVAGQATIDAVLPAFRAYVQDTVLVAHNAAFDLRFLQMKQAATGVVFDQPVLDTLLLSALVHPHQTSHRLEALAERFEVSVVGRHTALGDAMVTAEVFLRMLPLLQAQGIQTLGQAREAARQTAYARIVY